MTPDEQMRWDRILKLPDHKKYSLARAFLLLKYPPFQNYVKDFELPKELKIALDFRTNEIFDVTMDVGHTRLKIDELNDEGERSIEKDVNQSLRAKASFECDANFLLEKIEFGEITNLAEVRSLLVATIENNRSYVKPVLPGCGFCSAPIVAMEINRIRDEIERLKVEETQEAFAEIKKLQSESLDLLNSTKLPSKQKTIRAFSELWQTTVVSAGICPCDRVQDYALVAALPKQFQGLIDRPAVEVLNFNPQDTLDINVKSSIHRLDPDHVVTLKVNLFSSLAAIIKVIRSLRNELFAKRGLEPNTKMGQSSAPVLLQNDLLMFSAYAQGERITHEHLKNALGVGKNPHSVLNDVAKAWDKKFERLLPFVDPQLDKDKSYWFS